MTITMIHVKRSIVITARVPGFHQYDAAPAPVEFLASSHRHLFDFRVFFRVGHGEREREFFIEQSALLDWLATRYGSPCAFGSMSCESIALAVLAEFHRQNCYRVEVWEDGENGAIVEELSDRFPTAITYAQSSIV